MSKIAKKIKNNNHWKEKVFESFSNNEKCDFKSIPFDQLKLFIVKHDYWFQAVISQSMNFLKSCIEVDPDYFLGLKNKQKMNALYIFLFLKFYTLGRFVSWYYRYFVEPIVIVNESRYTLFDFLVANQSNNDAKEIIQKMMLTWNDTHANDPKNYPRLKHYFSQLHSDKHKVQYIKKACEKFGNHLNLPLLFNFLHNEITLLFELYVEKEVEICKIIFPDLGNDFWDLFFESFDNSNIRIIYCGKSIDFLHRKLLLTAIKLDKVNIFADVFNEVKKEENTLKILLDHIIEFDASECFSVIYTYRKSHPLFAVSILWSNFCQSIVKKKCVRLLTHVMSLLLVEPVSPNDITLPIFIIFYQIIETNDIELMKLFIPKLTATMKITVMISICMCKSPSLTLIDTVWPFMEDHIPNAITTLLIHLGYMSSLELLFSKNYLTNYLVAFNCAARYNRLDFMKWLVIHYGDLIAPFENQYYCTEKKQEEVIIDENDTLHECIKKVNNNVCSWKMCSLSLALKYDHLEIIKYLLSNFNYDEKEHMILSNNIGTILQSGNFQCAILMFIFGAKIYDVAIVRRSWNFVFLEAARQKVEMESRVIFPSGIIPSLISGFCVDLSHAQQWFICL